MEFLYIASDGVRQNKLAKVLGEATANPGLQCVVIVDEQFVN
jgi:hypothetical protein